MRRPAFTLLELMIVLALVVTLASVVTMTLRAPLSTQRLRAGSDVLRAAMGKTRNQAIRYGQPFLLSVQPDSDVIVISPWSGNNGGATFSTAAGNSGTIGTAPSANTGNPSEAPEPEQTIALPEGILVHEASVAALTLGEPTAEGQAQQIQFLPDGSTVDATITLRNESGDGVSVFLHGVTAGTRVGPISAVVGSMP